MAFCCLTVGGLSVAASKSVIVKLGHPRYLLGPEAKAVAATVEEASKVVLGGIDRALARVESRGDYIYVGWGNNDANVRDGGVSFHVDAKTFRITCREIDGKSSQRCDVDAKTSRLMCTDIDGGASQRCR